MNDYIWLIYYFAACSVMFIGMCIYEARRNGYLLVKDVFDAVFFSYMPGANMALLIIGFATLFGKLFKGFGDRAIWERKEND